MCIILHLHVQNRGSLGFLIRKERGNSLGHGRSPRQLRWWRPLCLVPQFVALNRLSLVAIHIALVDALIRCCVWSLIWSQWDSLFSRASRVANKRARPTSLSCVYPKLCSPLIQGLNILLPSLNLQYHCHFWILRTPINAFGQTLIGAVTGNVSVRGTLLLGHHGQRLARSTSILAYRHTGRLAAVRGD